MKVLLVLVSALVLQGCASKCTSHCVAGFGPGNSLFDKIAQYNDTQDPCQLTGKPELYQRPGFCGANKGAVIVRAQGNNSYRISINK